MNQPLVKRDVSAWRANLSVPWRWFIGVALVGLVSHNALLQAGHSNGHEARVYQLETISPAVPAPALDLAGLDGTLYQLSDYQGRVVVVNFWSTWCAPCRREMPALEDAWQRLRPSGVMVLGVAIQDDPEMVERFLQETRVTFPILIDRDGGVSQRWSFSGIPATFVLDKEGRIVYRALGLREWDSDEIVNRLIELADTD